MKKIVIIIGILSVFLCSCDTKKVFEENIKIEKGIWDNQKKATFEVLISDTLAVHNVFVNIRNTDLYQYSNIYLFIKTSSPDGYFLRDTLLLKNFGYFGIAKNRFSLLFDGFGNQQADLTFSDLSEDLSGWALRSHNTANQNIGV